MKIKFGNITIGEWRFTQPWSKYNHKNKKDCEPLIHIFLYHWTDNFNEKTKYKFGVEFCNALTHLQDSFPYEKLDHSMKLYEAQKIVDDFLIRISELTAFI